jgi:type IV pilus assembly protein PilF
LKPGLLQRYAARLALGLIAAALSACAGPGAVNAGASQELKTASDRTPGEKRASIRLQLAIGYFQDGKLEVALDEVKHAIAADPGFADAYGVRALIYSGMGELTLAEENFQRALALAPRNPELSNNYGSFLCQHGRGAQAMPYFEAALKNPTYQSPLRAMLNAGSCSLKSGNPALAERYLLEALRIEPEHPTASANLARLYFERRDYARAAFFMNRLKAVAKPDSLAADVLWLSIRIDHKLGEKASEASMVALLRRQHPGSPEYAAFQRGAFDE